MEVEVLWQDASTGVVTLEWIGGEPLERQYQVMSSVIFNQLFKPAVGIRKSEMDSYAHLAFPDTVDDKAKQIQLWSNYFSTTMVQNHWDVVMQKLQGMAGLLATDDNQSARGLFLECLFEFYMFSSRIGLPTQNHFQSIHDSVFAMVDCNEHDYNKTKHHYMSKGLVITDIAISVYDSNAPMAIPITYYVASSDKEQVDIDGCIVQKGTYLPSVFAQ
jgi:hypothetical protein